MMQKKEYIIKFREMLELQKKLNDLTCGKYWECGVTNKNKIIDWFRCMRMELSEAIDSFPWKHWKSINDTVDINNLKIEMIDTWHFLLSLIIVNMEATLDTVEGVSIKLSEQYNKAIKSNKGKNYTNEGKIKKIEEFIFNTFLCEQNSINLNALSQNYLNLLIILDIDIDFLYRLYVSKNVLNIFRQNNGYKEGEYNKIWNGKEDNEFLKEFLIILDDALSYDALYKMLDTEYKKHNL